MIAFLLAAALAIGDPAPKLVTQDVKGRAIEAPAPGHPLLLCFVGRTTADGAAKVSGVLHPRHPDLAIVNVIDLTAIPSLLRGFAKSKVEAKHAEAVRSAADSWRAAGKAPPDDLDLQVHLVPDFTGSLLQSWGVKGATKKATLFLVGADGIILGRWEGDVDPEMVDAALKGP